MRKNRAYDPLYYSLYKEKWKAYAEEHREEISARKKRYANDHREEISARGSEYWRTNKDLIVARRALSPKNPEIGQRSEAKRKGTRTEERRLYYTRNKESIREKNRAWYEAHKEEAKAYGVLHAEEKKLVVLRRRERLAGLPEYTFKWSRECAICGLTLGKAVIHLDHEPPIKWATRHPEYDGPFTLRPTHAFCNRRKHDRPDWER